MFIIFEIIVIKEYVSKFENKVMMEATAIIIENTAKAIALLLVICTLLKLEFIEAKKRNLKNEEKNTKIDTMIKITPITPIISAWLRDTWPVKEKIKKAIIIKIKTAMQMRTNSIIDIIQRIFAPVLGFDCESGLLDFK